MSRRGSFGAGGRARFRYRTGQGYAVSDRPGLRAQGAGPIQRRRAHLAGADDFTTREGQLCQGAPALSVGRAPGRLVGCKAKERAGRFPGAAAPPLRSLHNVGRHVERDARWQVHALRGRGQRPHRGRVRRRELGGSLSDPRHQIPHRPQASPRHEAEAGVRPNQVAQGAAERAIASSIASRCAGCRAAASAKSTDRACSRCASSRCATSRATSRASRRACSG